MGSGANAVFQEVLQINIDVNAFTTGLATLETAYEDFVDRLNAKGFGAGNVLSVGAFASVSSTLDELKTHFEAFDASLTKSFDSLEGVFAKAAQGIEATSQRLVDAEAAAAKAGSAGVPGVGAGAAGGVNLGPQVGFAQQFSAALGQGLNNLGGMAANLAVIQLTWKAINLAVEAFTAIIEAPFKFIANGVEYLKQLQEKAADLQGPLANAIRFSDDFATNFKIAGDQATIISKEFEEFSIKTGIASTQLSNAFKVVLDAGGAQLTGGLLGAVTLTEQFATLMRAAGTSVDGARKMLSEVPKALEGTLPPTSRLLQALNMTPEAFRALIEEAKKYGNLQDLLAERIKPFTTVIEQSENRLNVLGGELTLIFDRVAGVAAKPIFDGLIASAQKLKEFYEEHKNSINAIAATVGQLAAALVNVVVSVSSWFIQIVNIGGVFKTLIVTIQIFSEALTTILNGVTSIFNIFSKMIELLKDPATYAAPGAAFKKLFDEVGKQADDFNKKFIDGGNRVAATINNTPNGEDGIISNAPGRFGGKNLDKDKEAAAELHRLYEAAKNDIINYKAYYQENINTIKELEASRQISVAEATKRVKDELNQEAAIVVGLTEKYGKLILATGAKGAEQAALRLSETATNLKKADDKASSQADIANFKDQEAIAAQHYAALLRLATEENKAEIALAKLGNADGIVNKQRILDLEIQAEQNTYTAKRAILLREQDDAGANVKAFQAATDKLDELDKQHTAVIVLDSQRRRQIQFDEQQAVEQGQIKVAQGKVALGTSKEVGDIEKGRITGQQILDQNENLAKQTVAVARVNLLFAEQNRLRAEASGVESAILKAYEAEVAAKKQLQDAVNAADKAGNANIDNTKLPDLIKNALKDGADNLKAAFTDFKSSVQTLAAAIGSINDAVSNFRSSISQGIKQGGTLGGIGAGLSTAAQYDPEPISRAILQIGGGVLSFFGGMFTEHARKIAEEINKNVTKILQDYQNQSINLIQTITQLQQQRQDAINRLSGQKGGSDELKKILPGLDQQIAQLQLQATQIKTTFEQQLAVLQTHSSVLGSALQLWQQINAQVKAYLGAGGDAAKASQFLSDQLRALKESTQDTLNQAEDQAVKDAISLNDLLKQKVQLQKDYNAQVFAAQNADAIERRASPAVTAGLALAAQKQAFNDQMAALNSQIDLTTRKITLERTIFQVASDTAALQARSNDLAIIALQTQISQYKDMQKLVASIFQNPNTGLFSTGTNGPGTTVLPITINVNGGTNGKQIGSDIADALNTRLRSGFNPILTSRVS